MPSKSHQKLVQQLASKKVTERRAAVRGLWKNGDKTAAPAILKALQNESLDDPSVWQSKCLMIAALGDFGYAPAIPVFEQLAEKEFRSSPVIYAELAFALCRLKSIGSGAMEFATAAMKSKRPLFARGAFQAIYFMDLDLLEKEIVPLIRFAEKYSKQHPDDEQLTCMPRDYLAAAAYRWKGKAVLAFLHRCQATAFPHLQEIATLSLAGTRSTDRRLRWYK